MNEVQGPQNEEYVFPDAKPDTVRTTVAHDITKKSWISDEGIGPRKLTEWKGQ